MAPKFIISYDGTDTDDDALALGRMLAWAGAELSLAYVRHTREAADHRERLEHREAERLLERGARWLDLPDAERYVVMSASTGEGLRALAEQIGADGVVFGSDYRTAPGHVLPGRSAQYLLEGGPVAVAVAPAGVHEQSPLALETIAALDEGDGCAMETARSLAAATGAVVVVAGPETVPSLLVIGSRPEARRGTLSISAAAEYRVELASAPVLMVPRGVALTFTVSAGALP
jgi:nucleotide-binding universal stress UspA family protein